MTDEFEELKKIENNKVITESRLGDYEVGMVFAPRAEWPPIFKTLRLWK